MALLEIRKLRTVFPTAEGVAVAVDGLSLEVDAGSTVGLVGESGCGKSVTALSILGLLDPPGRIEAGEILFRGRDLVQLSQKELQGLRGNQISMVFQEPQTSLNPVLTVGRQVEEVLEFHRGMSRREARKEAERRFAEVGIPDPAQRVREYPHQLSGGMKQRVLIAMALACRPQLLIADEPTTALDVTVQAQILELLRDLQRDRGMSILLITHDLGVVAELCDEVAVMYASRLVERASTAVLLERPLHPYTVGLLESLPRMGPATDRLPAIPGNVPDLLERPSGCGFAPRCGLVEERCRDQDPLLLEHLPGRWAACHRAEGPAATNEAGS